MSFRAAIPAFFLPGMLGAAPLLPLRVVESSHMNFGHPLAELVDGNVDPGNGLDMDQAQFKEVSIVFATEVPVQAQVFQFTTWHISEERGAYPGELEISVTSDEKPGREGNWKPLKANLVITDSFPAYPDAVQVGEEKLILARGLDRVALTARAPTSMTGVTGFRLRFLPTDGGHISGQKVVGRSADGNCVINEFQIQPDPLRSSNVALGRPVRPSGDVYPGLHPHYLTDGFPATFSHPADTPARDFHFDVDLGATRSFDSIVLRNRFEKTYAERLGDYEVQLLSDNGRGQPGEVNWRARMRQDGTHVPAGGRDVIQAEDGTGSSFSGRYLRILNPTDAESRPQIAEVEVYPELRPRVYSVTADGQVVGPHADLPTTTRTLGFTLAADADDPVPELQTFRWRRPDQEGSPWSECVAGELITISCAKPGRYPIDIQARHTDGRWSRKVQQHVFNLPAPWWKRPLKLGAIIFSSLLAAAGLGWWLSVRRLRHKLQLAQAERAIEEDRLRIARDMHDDIGARLTHVAMLADRVKRAHGQEPEVLAKLAGEARNTVGALDEIVWAVNPRHDTLGSMADYLCNYVSDYLADAGLSCEFEISPGGREAVLPFAIRHPLMMAVKEAVQNIVKHAGANHVHVALQSTEDSLQLAIRESAAIPMGLTRSRACLPPRSRRKVAISTSSIVARMPRFPPDRWSSTARPSETGLSRRTGQTASSSKWRTISMVRESTASPFASPSPWRWRPSSSLACLRRSSEIRLVSHQPGIVPSRDDAVLFGFHTPFFR